MMDGRHNIATLLASGVVALAAVTVASTAQTAEFYAGKTLTIVSPVPGGSGLDRLTRGFARSWSKYIPGKPKIIVKNMPGGGFVKALNFVYERAKPDGLTVYWGPWKAAAVLAKQPGLRYVPEKFELIGTGGAYYISLIRTDALPGAKRPTDIVKAKSFNVGGRSASLVLDMMNNLSLEMLGVNFRFIGGYKGMAKIRPALLANEVQAAASGHIGYYVFFKDNEIKSGKVTALWYHPPIDAQGNPVQVNVFGKTKSFAEIYRQIRGEMPSGPLWEAYKWQASVPAAMSQTVFAPPGTPKAAVAALRKGHAATTRDKKYLAALTKKMGAPLRFLDLEQGLGLIANFRTIDPKVTAVFQRMGKLGQR
jgi:putative tricarboxylic transport membrane protein